MASMRAAIFCGLTLFAQEASARLFLKPRSSLSPASVIYNQSFAEVKLGPFDTEADACDYCSSSYTKQGDAPAGPIAPQCVCMALPDAAATNKFTMFCATPPSAAGYVGDKKGCTCKFRDMENMGKTTCKKI
eukprot:TRINITY_DN20644_c0_g1_i1.p1 TRINITY_DN20644_c0_g1~~TRINITY_DN20644_c0_g1_i1.p1  ORF type:complete len:132 (+),score=31.50 TRINITY_DN20644_c0_g1_i1:82-477(+)